MSSENEIIENQIEEISSEQKKARRFIIIWTWLYMICFPFVLWMTLWSILVFDSPSMTVPIGLSIILACLCIPLSMLVSVWKMWSQYFKKKYRALPFFTFMFAIIVNVLFQKLFLGR